MKRSAAASPAEQKSFAEELDRRVALRTAELTAANEQLKRELSERQQAKEVLREGELFSLIVESIPVPVAITSPTGEVEALNKPTLEYFGRTFEELKGWKSSDVVHPDDLQRTVATQIEALQTGSAYNVESRHRRADGTYRWFNVLGLPLRDAQGHILRWFILQIDIDDRKQAEEALRSVERNLHQIINTIPTHIYVLNTEGSVQYVNQAVMDYTGLNLENVRQEDYRDRVIHPEDFKRVRAGRAASLRRGAPFSTEQRVLSNDGQYRWFLVRYKPLLDEQGRIVRWYVAAFDIEDRKRAEEALRSAERNLDQIINTIPALAWSARPDGSAEFFNQQYLDFVGLSAEQASGWGWVAAIHPDDRDSVAEAWQRIMASAEPGEAEARMRGHDGEYRWFLVRASPVRDDKGNILKWYGINTDIDDLKKAEAAQQSSERNLREITNVIPTNVHVLRPDGSVLYVNQPVLDYTGLTMSDVLKEDYRARVFHPEDLERIREERQDSLTRPVLFENEQRALGKDGKYRWFLARYNPLLDKQGRIDRWYVASFDIEDRKRAEAEIEQAYLRLAEAQRVSKTGSFITDLLLDEHNWSEELRRIFELDPGTRVTSEAIRALFHPEDLPVYEDAFKRAVDGLVRDIDISYRIITPAGNVKHLHAVTHVLEKIAGRPVYIGAIQDVTESKVAEQALTKARAELAHMARVTTLSVLTASISHEVNQPLSGIITNASTCLRMLAADPPNVDGARETTQRTIRDGLRAADVITRLRALFTRKEITFEAVDLNEAAREVIALSLSDLQRNRVTLRSQLADDLPLVSGDRVQLQQVILNLVRNASDAMSIVNGRPRHLLIKTEPDEGDQVRLSVQDAGVGFDPQSMKKLFEAFYTTKNEGMGIGLSVSRSIIESHHGRLWATPNDGPGATFSFSIPREP